MKAKKSVAAVAFGLLAVTLAPTSATAVTSAPCASTSVIKSYLGGNMSRQQNQIDGRNAANATYVTSMVMQFDWKNLEPTMGKYDFSAIDAQVAWMKARGLTGRLRIIGGVFAPAYTKTMGGPAITIYDHQRQINDTMPRYWNSDYQARWQALQRALAARYDGEAVIREVNISGTGVFSAEPMLTMENDKIPGTTKTNQNVMAAAGLTETKRRNALDLDIAFMQNTWKRTHTALFAHPYQAFNTSVGDGLATTQAIIAATHKRKPGHTTFGHTGASEGIVTGVTHPTTFKMYQWLAASGYPFMLQTQSYNGGGGINEGVGNLSVVLDWAAKNKVLSVELPAGWINDAAKTTNMKSTSLSMVNTTKAFNLKYSAQSGTCVAVL